MSFLYPLFLAAGAALLIPILIHLFNLRRYKTVYFPHTRFLKDIQLRSQKSSQVRYKLLLLTRLLFLAALILAFAQPFFKNKDQAVVQDKLEVIYIDNSGSMSLKKGAQRLLDVAKNLAYKQVQQAPLGTKFVLLTNDRTNSYTPLPVDQAMKAINRVELTAGVKQISSILTQAHSLMESEGKTGADLYYYADFQQSSVSTPSKEELKDISFYGIQVQADKVQNVYIDTAYLTSPVLQTGVTNQLVVRTKAVGDAGDTDPVMQLLVNGQVKNAATLQLKDAKEATDTLSFQVDDAGWQQIELVLDDANLPFDDTFRIAARSAPNLSVLVLNEGQANPFIQAAFRAYSGFRLDNKDANSISDLNAGNYNLIILNNITRPSTTLTEQITTAVQQGKSVCIFPGKSADVGALNELLGKLADVRITGLDTGAETVSTIQQGSELVQDLFDNIPDNVQLPTTNWHYNLTAGLSANQQSVLSYRNGDPFFVRYSPSKGTIYMTATGIDMQSGNFPNSYFFVPFLYQMATRSAGGNVYALTLGKQQAAFLPLNNATERNMIHLYAPNTDAIPLQRSEGAGLNVFVDRVVNSAGFYDLAAPQTQDTTRVAVNLDRAESKLEVWTMRQLQDQWQGLDVQWLLPSENDEVMTIRKYAGFPLWKLCVIFALIMLIAETIVLTGNLRKKTTAT